MDPEQKKRPRVVKRVVISFIMVGICAAIGWWLYASVLVGRVAAVYVAPGNLFLGRITWFPHPVLHDPWVLVFGQQPEAQGEAAADGAQAAAEPRVLPWTSAIPFIPKGKRVSVPKSSIIQWAYLDKSDSFRQFLARGGQQAQNTLVGLGGLGGVQQQGPQGGLPQQQAAPGGAQQLPVQPRF